MHKVFISVGHGGSDPGACGNGLQEKAINLRVALKVKEVLVSYGFNVKMSRERDESDRVSDEVKECNAFNPDFTVSIHTNAGGGDGFEAYYYKGDQNGIKLGKLIEEEVKAIGQNSRGIKDGSHLYYVKNTRTMCVLVELAFIDNKKDITIVDELHEQDAFGVAIAKGILKYKGISYKDTTTNTSTIKIGSKVKVKANASNWATGQPIPDWVKSKEYKVTKIDKDKALLDEVISWVYLKDVEVRG